MGIKYVKGVHSPWGERAQALMISFMLCGGENNSRLSPLDASRHPKRPVKVSVSTLTRWWSHYILWGETPHATKKRGVRTVRTRGCRLKNVHGDHLKGLLDKDPQLFVDELASKLRSRFNIAVSNWTVERYIKKKMRMSLKCICLHAKQASAYEQRMYKSFLSTIEKPDMFVFVDETAVGEKSVRRRRGWSPKGEPAVVACLFLGDEAAERERYTVIGAVDINGFVLNACDRIARKASKTDPAPYRGTVGQDYFRDWVESMLVPTLGKFDLNEPRSVVVMDNATIHKHPDIITMIEAAGAMIYWTAAYSPELNPIEKCFFLYKQWCRRHRSLFLNKRISLHLAALAECVDRSKMINLYKYHEMEGCIRNLPCDDNDDDIAYDIFKLLGLVEQ